MLQIIDLEPKNYQRHFIHDQARNWAETNCYTDVWIELLHALGYEPVAAMPFTFGIDFEGDQWTFFKFQITDLYELYGIEIQELAIWKPLTIHIQEQLSLGRLLLVELDSMYLPDTAGTAYQLAHVKTTVAINMIDLKNKRLGYFHAQGYYYLEGNDFDNIFRINDKPTSSVLPPYVEIAKLNKAKHLDDKELLAHSKRIFVRHLSMLPLENPFVKFKTQLIKDLDWLKQQDIEMFHQYSFATFRQLGACYELSANYIEWLIACGEKNLELPLKNLKLISETAKIYQFQLARVISRGKSLDLASLDKMSECWIQAIQFLKGKFFTN